MPMIRYRLFATQLYCYPMLRPLQEAILKRGDKVAWFLHKTPNLLTDNDGPLLETVEAVQKYNPTAVYVPTNWVPDFFPGVKVQVFHGFDVGYFLALMNDIPRSQVPPFGVPEPPDRSGDG